MKQILNVAVLALLMGSCKTTEHTPKSEWLFAYKAQACTSCLGHLGVLIHKDNSGWLRFEVLGDRFVHQADSLGKAFTDTVSEKARYFRNSDLEGGKAITNGCLLFYSSRKLAVEAERAYKKYKKEESY